jgi:prophage regulatory protein
MIVKLPEILSQRARSSSSHYRDIQDGLYTKPVNLGKKAVGWPINEVNILNAARIAALSEEEIRELVIELHAKRKLAFSALMEGGNA